MYLILWSIHTLLLGCSFSSICFSGGWYYYFYGGELIKTGKECCILVLTYNVRQKKYREHYLLLYKMFLDSVFYKIIFLGRQMGFCFYTFQSAQSSSSSSSQSSSSCGTCWSCYTHGLGFILCSSLSIFGQ